MAKEAKWCCNLMRETFSLTIDDQDVREIFGGKCPYCKKVASYGIERAEPRDVSDDELKPQPERKSWYKKD